MNDRVSIRIHSDHRFGLAALLGVAVLVGAFLAYLLWGQTQFAAGMEISQSSSAPRTARAATTGGVREYYLTWDMVDGNEAVGECAAAYHMASVWELLDTSNLQYNTILGRTQPDSGYGPPSGWEGWVRTGYGISTTGPAGQANCNGWSSDSIGHDGTSLYLPYDWEADQELSTWITGTWSCNTTMPVWCVADEDSGIATGVAGMRQYYLTASGSYIGSQASTACAAGYHMASLWEILDPSNLRYNTNLGDSRLDSGMGPPSASVGWIRTGYSSNDGSDPAHGPGRPNCSAWSSSSATNYGTTLNLPSDWMQAGQQDVSVWDAGWRQCSEIASVWCVADMGACGAPLYIGCGQTINGDTSVGFANNIGLYTCSAWNESGPETIYAFTLAAGDFYTVTAELSNLGADLDVFLLSSGGCASAQCLEGGSYGNTIATMGPVPPGTYYVAVDGYEGAVSSYTLSLTCTGGAGEKGYMPLVLRDYQ